MTIAAGRKEREEGREEGKRQVERRKSELFKTGTDMAFHWDSVIHMAPPTPFFVPRLMEGRQN